MNDKVKCPIPVGMGECRREVIVERKFFVRRLPDTGAIVIHYECELHKFHRYFPLNDPAHVWFPCDCEDMS